MEDRRLYLAPYKYENIISWPIQTERIITYNNNKEKRNAKKTLKMPADMTTNIKLDQLARRMHVPYFRSAFMRHETRDIIQVNWTMRGVLILIG